MNEYKEYGYHKLEVGQKIRVFKTTFNDRNFYKYRITQKNYDGTLYKPYIELQFKKGVDIPNETDIIVHQFVENHRPNPNDKFHSIQWYQINDFEIVENEERNIQNAYDEFRENLDSNDMVEITADFLD